MKTIGARKKKATSGRVRLRERQLDRAFEQQIFMRHGARRDADVEKSKKIAEPKSRADSGRVLDALARRVEIMRLCGEFFDWVGSGGVRA